MTRNRRSMYCTMVSIGVDHTLVSVFAKPKNSITGASPYPITITIVATRVSEIEPVIMVSVVERPLNNQMIVS